MASARYRTASGVITPIPLWLYFVWRTTIYLLRFWRLFLTLLLILILTSYPIDLPLPIALTLALALRFSTSIISVLYVWYRHPDLPIIARKP